MIKKLSALLAIAGLLYAVAACKKENTTVPPAFAHFNYVAGGDYFVTQDANTIFKIPVGITAVSESPKTVQITVSSPTGAVEGQQYTVQNKTITIPAGKAVDTLFVKGIFAGYPTGRKDTLVFTISGSDPAGLTTSKQYKLVVQKYCTVNINDFTGVYDAQDYYDGAPDGAPYTIAVTPGAVTGNTGKVTMAGLWGVPTPFTVNLDWKNPAAFTTEVPVQAWFVHGTYGQTTISPNGKGTFSSCDNTFRIDYEVTVSAGTFGKYYTLLKK